jgi:HEAT repeat protein
MIAELLLKLREGHPDFTDDCRFQYFYLNRLKWTESIVQILAELEDESQILRIVRLALEVDLLLGARLSGSVQAQFQEKTIAMINALEISDRDKVNLLGITKSDAAIRRLSDTIKHGVFEHYTYPLNVQAVRELGSFGTESTIPALAKAIQDKDFDVRESASGSLIKIGGDLAVYSLIEALPLSEEYARPDIIRTLGSLGNRTAIPALINIIENDSSDFREQTAEAAKALGDLDSADAVPLLIRALADDIYYVHDNAMEALGKIGGEAAIDALTECLEKDHLRRQAARALAKLGEPTAIPLLLKYLKMEPYRDAWFDYAVESLRLIYDEQTVLVLINALDEDDFDSAVLRILGNTGKYSAISLLINDLSDKYYYTRCQAVLTLGKIGCEPEFKILLDVLNKDSDSSVRTWATRAIMSIASRHQSLFAIAVQSLKVAARKDESDSVRRSVMEILSELGDPTLINEFINALDDENYSVRISAAKALIKFNNEIAIPALINSLTNKDWWVGYYSIEALEKFSDRTIVRDALFSIITDLVPSKPEITPEAVKTLKIRSAHALGFYNYEIEKLNIQ